MLCFKVLIEALNSSACERAAYALEEIGGEKAIPALIEALRDENAYVRMSAAEALEQLNVELLAKGLESALPDKNSFIRRKAAES